METGMDAVGTVLDAAAGMAGRGGVVDTFVMSEFLKVLRCDAQEMSMPIVEGVAGVLAARGATSSDESFSIDGVRAWSPPLGTDGRIALVLQVASGGGWPPLGTATVLSMRDAVRRTNPEFDGLLAKMRAAAAASKVAASRPEPTVPTGTVLPRAEADPFGHRLAAMRTDVFVGGEAEALEAIVAGSWSHDKLAEVRRSLHSEEGWMAMGRADGGSDFWDVHFAVLGRIATGLGLDGFVREVAADFAARRWDDPSEGDDGLSPYGAAARAARLARSADGGLPGAGARRAVQAVEGFAMELDMARIAGMSEEIVSMAEAAGHVGTGSAFGYNADDELAILGPDASGARSLWFCEQNHAQVLRISDDGTRWSLFSHVHGDDGHDRFPPVLAGAATGTADERDALAVFERQVDGTMRLSKPFEGDLEDVRSWNGFVGNVRSGHCCLEDEYGAASAPGV